MRHLELIEALTKPAEPSPEPEYRIPIGMGIKASSVPAGGLAADIDSFSITRSSFGSPLIYHTRDEADRDLGAEDRMWRWFYDLPNPVDQADCIFLGYPCAATPQALRACIDAAAAASPQTREILARVGLLG